MNSQLAIGDVYHHRFEHTDHKFRYPLYMMWLDLDELTEINDIHPCLGDKRRHLLRFVAADYLKDYEGDLKSRALSAYQAAGGAKSVSKVFSLCQGRCFGLYFSPVNFYFYQNAQGEFTDLLAEVSNTPWRENHLYLVPLDKKVNLKKAFHVSPFMDLNMDYHWQVKVSDDKLLVQITNQRGDEKVFHATLRLKRTTLSKASVTALLRQFPAMTWRIVSGIYWQALKLWLRKVPFVAHPER
ncbi:DUF1365 domain-containing protein [Pseudoalteromonas fenneropenaei]|uniref:DUF1365 domain-containing protein n=1 Tax=Pseudoalteromonas fenneropenaei TaxID=1737459 RepID=A0ABV7CML0_9GAMM